MASNEFVVPERYEDLTPAPNVDQKTLNRMALRSCWLQSSFNYETMQSGGWLFAMIPGLEKVHTNKNDLAASMYHNLDFINTHPFLVTFVMGIVLSLEQNKVDTQTIRAVRISAASPLGGIGDALFWLTLVPITAGITSNMALEGNIIAPIIFLVIFNAAQFACRFGELPREELFGLSLKHITGSPLYGESADASRLKNPGILFPGFGQRPEIFICRERACTEQRSDHDGKFHILSSGRSVIRSP